MKMKQSEDYMATVVILALVCACATGYPLSQNSPRQLSDILDELKKELLANQKQGLVPSYLFPGNSLDTNNIQTPVRNLGYLQQKSSGPAMLDSGLEGNPLTDRNMEKRQGSWDYDYGLGGGRFGKRAGLFGDYSIGGGRFGRDVEHVLDKDFDEDLDG